MAFTVQKGNIYAVPIIHYNMESAAQVRLAFQAIQPDCVAVELPETLTLQMLHAASRLPDISVVVTQNDNESPLYFMCEPCDGAFEALRSALESEVSAHCIDLDVDQYPERLDLLPDPYAIQRIGLEAYYSVYKSSLKHATENEDSLDKVRELFMAKRLKELSLRYDKILFVGGMAHIERVLQLIDLKSYPTLTHSKRDFIHLCTLTEESCRDAMAECGWVSNHYEKARSSMEDFPPDRQKLIFNLYKGASEGYKESTGNPFAGYNLRNIMKFVRNYALITNHLMPDLYQLLAAAKACVDHNYAYECWTLATDYIHHKNVDNLPEIDLSIEDIWGHSKLLRFHLKSPSRKGRFLDRRRKDNAQFRFKPPGMFSICSYPPEDLVIERFGEFLKKKGTQILTEEASRTIPFTSSIEDGIDTKETIRHWHEKKLYVKTKGKPPGGVGSVVIIFDEDQPEKITEEEHYPWRTTWLGEHEQESDMSFYATPLGKNVVGPGISRCEYGGFMMSYPPRRLFDIWTDPDYEVCQKKSEVLLMAAIDYAVHPLIVYVAATPPRSIMKSFAKRYGKKVVYIPLSQLSPITLNKLRVFHVLDGHDKREIAGDYIF